MKIRSSSAFTLIEMVIVVLILAVLATAAVPPYLAMRDRNALRGSAEQMLSVLAEHRLRAVKENFPVEVNFEPTLDFVAERVDIKDNTLGDIVYCD